MQDTFLNSSQILNLATGETRDGPNLPDDVTSVCAARYNDTIYMVGAPRGDPQASLQLYSMEGR